MYLKNMIAVRSDFTGMFLIIVNLRAGEKRISEETGDFLSE